ncbi:phosphate acetyltransferase [Ruixingdingia sedimenti]|uniref:Phosphate acetyltransferase n=1 Tax=Ruixingdingia sedimenti TaxID=3073604 RepID=A0ABU1F8P3_9RHOB|nr:phosphate acetyltransferase [Xinfangfangia sp. LG-4]MDR5652817.1 phosphate acetyltransferase [Xinfangfangia sp. LG-4]
MQVGDFAELRRTFTAGDMAGFAALAGVEAGDRVPEPLLAALVSYLLGVKLPGPGTNYLKQELAFPAPAPLDAPLTARVEVTRLRADKRIADLWATCRTADGTLVAEGRSLVKYADSAHGR